MLEDATASVRSINSQASPIGYILVSRARDRPTDRTKSEGVLPLRVYFLCVSQYFPEFYTSTLEMIRAQGAIVGWTATTAELRDALG